MHLFAVKLPHAARSEFLFLLELLFTLLVLLSFIAVATYVTRQLRAGRFLNGENTPKPFTVSGPFGFFFAASVLVLVFLQSLFYPMVVLFGLAGVLLQDGRTAWEQFGLGRLRPMQVLNWSLLGCGAVILVGNPLYQAAGWLMDLVHVPHPEQESVETFRQYNQSSAILGFMFQAVFLFPVIEELFFRGFLLTFLKKYTSTWLALVLSAGVFAFAHVNLDAVLPLWFLGVVLGMAYEQTGSLLLPMGIHACFNLVTALNLLLDKGGN